jgi:hypothetical protein
MNSNEAFEAWIGQSADAADGGWRKEVWDTAWAAATSHITAWANTVTPPCDEPWQDGYEHARRWVKEIGLK